MSRDILSSILKAKKASLKKNKEKPRPLEIIRALSTHRFKKAISQKGRLNLIAEIKKASPSRGIICRNFNPLKIAKIYENSLACALSILTEEKFFRGRLSYIKLIKREVNLPILRKDFIIDESQIYESKIAGADAILLISQILELKQLKHFLNLAKKVGLDCLVEVHTRKDLRKALDAKAEIIGINNRSLHTFKVDLNTTKKLISFIPKDKIIVSESGITTRQDIKLLRDLGVDAVLIGEAFLKAKDISSKIKELFP